MKRLITLMLALLLIGSCALAAGAPQLSGGLYSAAKQAVGYLASGEYERLVTLLPFSGTAPSASEWESFARNYRDTSNIQRDYAVAYWTGSAWRIAVPLQVPSSGGVEVLMLISEDGSTLTGYRYATWSQVEGEYGSSDHILWNQEYVSGPPQVYAD